MSEAVLFTHGITNLLLARDESVSTYIFPEYQSSFYIL
jgi:hypothetical protein